MTDVFEAIEQAVNEAAEKVGPAVVGLGRGWGRGSGVVIAPRQVLTVAHVLRGDEVAVGFAGGDVRDGRVLGVDSDLDVAVIGVDTGDAPAIGWEPSDDGVAAGRPVFALANPGGRGLRTTFGLVSTTGRGFRGPRGRRVAGAIEHTAPLPRGSSGGPLVDVEGRLLGLNAVRLEGALFLADPANASVKERAESLGRGEAPTAPRLGVAVAPPRVARRMRRAVGLPEQSGLLVRGVEDGSPAAAAGIERGDLLVAAAGRELDGVDALYEVLDGVADDGSVELTVVRGTDERPVQVEFGAAGAPA